MSHETQDLTVQILAIGIPIFMTIIMGLLTYAVQQTIGRVNDKLTAVHAELTKHQVSCEKVDKAGLQKDISRLEDEVGKLRNLMHWISN